MTDHVPEAVKRAVEAVWPCRVFNHYGMSEMGLGGGVECEARDGYHLREADLHIEIVDPETGRSLPDGDEGEIVFTILTPRGMPLIRQRTGDLGRFLTDPCPCGAPGDRGDLLRQPGPPPLHGGGKTRSGGPKRRLKTEG